MEMEIGTQNTPRTVKLYKLGRAEVAIGALKFQILHRIVIVDDYEDHGASIDVYGPVDGQETELIKFDCFEKGPHYHAPASAAPTELDTREFGDGLDWALGVIRDGLPELLSAAGYNELSGTLDRALLAARWTDVRDAVRATAPASYDVPAGVSPIIARV
ncbi:MAG TPA: hypothetical protein VMS55_09445 [Myxococcota bacterium]|nr:hypothetical protein [Myxococcota bacterium]